MGMHTCTNINLMLGIICKKNEEIDHLKTQFEKGTRFSCGELLAIYTIQLGIGEKDEEIDHLKHGK